MTLAEKIMKDTTKLPLWAQDLIKRLERQKTEAVDALNKWCNDQTPSPIRIQELVCIGESTGASFKTRFIQGKSVQFEWGNISLDVRLKNDGHRKTIELQWDEAQRRIAEVAMIPKCYQQVELINQTDMRK